MNSNDPGRRQQGPSTTDWQEHGAAGDISTGRRLKYVQDVPMAILVDEVGNVTYVGFSKPGILPSQELWRIMRITENGGETTIEFANGKDTFENLWTNRASLSYL
jgi:hypothetical protein